MSIQDENKKLFVPAKINDSGKFEVIDDIPVYTIGEEVIPLVESAFDVKLIHPSSTNGKKELQYASCKFLYKNADFDDEGHDTAVDTLHLLPIAIVRDMQKMYRKEFVPGQQNGLLCQSYNRLTPDPNIAKPCSAQCGNVDINKYGKSYIKITCPHGIWDKENNIKAQCREYLSVAFFDLDKLIPVVIEFHSTTLGVWNSLMNSYSSAKSMAIIKRKNIYNYLITMKTGMSGSFATIEASFGEDEAYGKVSRYLPVVKYYIDTLLNDVNAVSTAAITSTQQPVEQQKEITNFAFEGDSENEHEGDY